MIPSWAKSGAKVICVDVSPKMILAKNGKFYPSTKWITMPCEGEIYTIEAVCGKECDPGIRLKEIDNSTRPGNIYNMGYALWRFRPLITEADDIALFKSLLNPTLVDKLDLLAERLDHIYNE